LIQKHRTGVARAVRKLLVSIAVSGAGDNKWAVCPPGHHAIRSILHAAAARHAVAGTIGGLRFGALNRDRAIDPIARGVIGHRWIRGPAWMVGFSS
jgi:hypothetical protein